MHRKNGHSEQRYIERKKGGKSVEGIVFSIEEFSVFDGPGIRTTVFLKGCPLSCSWCHNPEGQRFGSEILRNPVGCIGCGNCREAARKATGSPAPLTKESIDVCPRQLVKTYGTAYTPEAMAALLMKNKRFFDSSGGGVTFSGGEPLSQSGFLCETLSLLEGHLHRAVQTSGYAPPAVFDAVLQKTDLFLYDIKVVDRDDAMRYTGVDNAPILRNFETLAASGVAFIPRIPLIPGVTDTEKNLSGILALFSRLGVNYAEGLPYNKLAGAKYGLAGKAYTPDFDPEKEPVLPVSLFARSGITLKIL